MGSNPRDKEPAQPGKAAPQENALAATHATLARAELEADEYLAAIIESSADAIISKNLQGVITSWNKSAEHVFGYRADEIVGQSVLKLIPADRRSEESEIMSRLENGERIEFFETVRLRKDGTPFPVSLSISPIHNRAGKIVGASKILRDISGYKREQARLRETEQQVRRNLERLEVFSASAASLLRSDRPEELIDGIFDRLASAFGLDFYFHFVADPGTCRMRLDAFRGITAQQAEQIEFLEFGEAVSGTVARDLQPMVIADVQQSADPITKFIRSLGMTAYVCHPMVANGRLLGTLSFGTRRHRAFEAELVESIRTLTDMIATAVVRRDVEEALAKAHRELEHRAADLEDAFRERTAKLEEAVTDLESFSYTVSHDLRSPLRTMQGFAHLVLEDYGAKLDARARDYLSRIDRAAERMDLLITEVLAYSRLGRASATTAAIDLEKTIDDIIRHHPAFQSPRCEIEIVRPLGRVLGNRAILEQAITQLLDNAAKFVPAGAKPRIRISTGNDGDYVTLAIEDQGIGIPAPAMQHIFKPFHRAHPDAPYPGTGMGLAIVKRGIERQGGSVNARSSPGAGSVFSLRLPIVKDPAGERAA